MKRFEPNITVNVDLTNPGQFFACCGLLELADRLWPGAEGWFEAVDSFAIRSETTSSFTLAYLCSRIVECELCFLLSIEDRAALDELSRRKASLRQQNRSLSKEDKKERKRLNSKRIASGFRLASQFRLRIDWWLLENCDGDHLKTWAGQQAIASIAKAIHGSLTSVSEDDLLEYEALVMKGSEVAAPLSFDSGRVGTAQDIGYSPDKIGQPICCCIWTEFLTLIALQRFSLRPDLDGFFTYHVWHEPLQPTIAAVAARGLIPQLVGCEGRFRLAGRDCNNRYKAFQQATLSEWRY